ncbi:MAG: hypothetical protein GY805_02010, partial [Chloroflexi bacterium]|nr:hypothetical protein [Chloroflexota bacterium]
MKTNLTVNDPLAEQEVNIIITLTASPQPRDERPVMVSIGVAEQMPISKIGTFGNLQTLIDEAWTAFGVQTQVAAATSVAKAETVAEEQVIATASIEEDIPAATRQPNSAPSKP